MSNLDTPATVPCPNCRQPMQTQALEQNYHGTVQVDLCFSCAGIWFDRQGSMQLAPGAVIELFKEIHAHLDGARPPVANRLDCPRCGDALAPGFDLSKSGKFSYFRCLRGDGRFTPFFQFLREKQFVRSLTAVEIQRVRSQVRQIRCSECGAPIDLETMNQCQYCHAPVSFLDPEAMEKALHLWNDAADRRRNGLTPEGVQNALKQLQLPHEQQAASSSGAESAHLLAGATALAGSSVCGGGLGLDLVAIGINAIGRLLKDRL